MLSGITLLALISEFAYNYLVRLELSSSLGLTDMTTNNMTTEILIIGGGITGTSTAYFLTQAGHEVTLLIVVFADHSDRAGHCSRTR